MQFKGHRIGLTPEQFEAAFPFHFVLDRELKILQTGASLGRVCPDLAPGADARKAFRAVLPDGDLSREWIQENHRSFFLLEHLSTGVKLRGEFIRTAEAEPLLFLGSPWFTNASEIVSNGLCLEDFAIHDSAVDLLHAHEASRVALTDAKKLAEMLTVQR